MEKGLILDSASPAWLLETGMHRNTGFHWGRILPWARASVAPLELRRADEFLIRIRRVTNPYL